MKISIGKKVLFSLLFVALLAVAASSIIAIVQAQNALRETTLRGFENVAEELFYTIRHSVQGGIESAQIVANDPIIRSEKSWTWQKEETLKQLKTIIKAYEDITLIAPDGNVITSTDYNFRGSWKHKSHFKNALRGKASASNVRLIPNPTKLIISFTAPVFNSANEVVAVVAMQLNLNNINRVVRHIKIEETGHAVLLDEYGRYLVHWDKNKVLEKANPSITQQLDASKEGLIYAAEKGGVYLGNYFSTNKLRKTETVSADEPNWTVVISQSRPEIYQKLEGIRSQLMVAAGGIFLVIIFIAVLVSRTITNPIRILQKGTEIFRKGELRHQVKIKSRDEIGDLAGSFNTMATDLLAYQTDLEQKVADRTAALSARNKDMRLVMENVDQGFITVFKNGVMSPERSAIVGTWFSQYEEGMTFQEFVANVDETFAEWFELAWDDLLADIMPIEVVVDQMPKSMVASNRNLQFSYSPILDEENQLMGLLVVIADITEQLKHEKKETQQREILNVFKRVSQDKVGYLAYQADAQKRVDAICATDTTNEDMVHLKRQIHTLKGNSGLFGITSVTAICHQMENKMDDSTEAPTRSERNELLHCWNTLLNNTKLFTTSAQNTVEISSEEYETVMAALAGAVPNETILEQIKGWALEPVSRQFARIEEQATALAVRLQKGLFVVEKDDGNVRLEPKKWSAFWSCLSHVVRNAVDHGLESPDQRDAHKEQGKLTLKCVRSNGTFVINIGDNGEGIDWDKVRDKAEELGISHGSHEELVSALFADGMSTKETASETSGRGVGLSAVKDAVDNLSGTIEIDSTKGKGTVWKFTFPA